MAREPSTFFKVKELIDSYNSNINYTYELYYAVREKYYEKVSEEKFYKDAFDSMMRFFGG